MAWNLPSVLAMSERPVAPRGQEHTHTSSHGNAQALSKQIWDPFAGPGEVSHVRLQGFGEAAAAGMLLYMADCREASQEPELRETQGHSTGPEGM